MEEEKQDTKRSFLESSSQKTRYLNSLIRWGKLRGPFEVLFRLFWETYLEASGDKEVTETAAPFFAFRLLVVASPLWYPNLSIDTRRSLFRFVENVLDVPRFEPERVNEYCGVSWGGSSQRSALSLQLGEREFRKGLILAHADSCLLEAKHYL